MLAIVIPFYNIEFFEETLSSLANQYNKEFNVYIGNDCSNNDPLQLIEFYGKILNIRYKKFNNNFGGISLALHWERCMEMVDDEEWIMILGDDDILDKNVVEKWYGHRDVFENYCNVVRFSSQVINSSGIPTTAIYTHPVWELAEKSILRKLNHLTRSSLSEHIFRKSIYKKYGFKRYDLAWFSDDRAWLDFSEEKPIFTINEALVQIRVSEKSISGKTHNNNDKISAANKFFRSLIKEKMARFDRSQRVQIFRLYEKLLRKTGINNFRSWLFLLLHYIKYSSLKDIIFYLKRSLKHYL